jgi:outer membrane protein OmpA-like peptidoglycan-associated protein
MRTLGLAVAGLIALGSCAKKSEPPTPVPAPAAKKEAEAPIVTPVYFDTGSTSINADGEKAVDTAAGILKSTDWNVIVLGLADATGDAETNRVLSQQRADAVAALLRTKSGVPESRIIEHAIGEKLATGSTVVERKVEFVFYHESGLRPRAVVEQSGVLTEDFQRKEAAGK